jgi:hypothetical protein
MARMPMATPATAITATSHPGAPRSIAPTMTNPSNREISVNPTSSWYPGRQPGACSRSRALARTARHSM